MIKTYRALMVRLTEPFLGESSRTVSCDKVESLLVSLETQQAFIVTANGNQRVAIYAQVDLAPGELERAMAVIQCEICSNVFETEQGLAGHKRLAHAVPVQSAVGASVRLPLVKK